MENALSGPAWYRDMEALMAAAQRLRSVWVIRHGATALNAQDRIRGQADVPLSAQGRREVEALGRRLRSSGIEFIVHSDLSRAGDTAAAIAHHTRAPLVASPLLRPWDVGIFTGVESSVAHPQMMVYARERPDEPIPRGESFRAFTRRAFTGLLDAFVRAQGRELAVVTHHRVERLVAAWRAAGMPASHELDHRVMFTHGEDTASAERVALDVGNLGVV